MSVRSTFWILVLSLTGLLVSAPSFAQLERVWAARIDGDTVTVVENAFRDGALGDDFPLHSILVLKSRFAPAPDTLFDFRAGLLVPDRAGNVKSNVVFLPRSPMRTGVSTLLVVGPGDRIPPGADEAGVQAVERPAGLADRFWWYPSAENDVVMICDYRTSVLLDLHSGEEIARYPFLLMSVNFQSRPQRFVAALAPDLSAIYKTGVLVAGNYRGDIIARRSFDGGIEKLILLPDGNRAIVCVRQNVRHAESGRVSGVETRYLAIDLQRDSVVELGVEGSWYLSLSADGNRLMTANAYETVLYDVGPTTQLRLIGRVECKEIIAERAMNTDGSRIALYEQAPIGSSEKGRLILLDAEMEKLASVPCQNFGLRGLEFHGDYLLAGAATNLESLAFGPTTHVIELYTAR